MKPLVLTFFFLINFTIFFCMGGRFIIANRIIFCFFTIGGFLLLANAIVFYRSLNFFLESYSYKVHLLGLLFWGSYLAVFLNHFYTSLGDMKIHGIVYGLTLSTSGSIAIMDLLRKV